MAEERPYGSMRHFASQVGRDVPDRPAWPPEREASDPGAPVSRRTKGAVQAEASPSAGPGPWFRPVNGGNSTVRSRRTPDEAASGGTKRDGAPADFRARWKNPLRADASCGGSARMAGPRPGPPRGKGPPRPARSHRSAAASSEARPWSSLSVRTRGVLPCGTTSLPRCRSFPVADCLISDVRPAQIVTSRIRTEREGWIDSWKRRGSKPHGDTTKTQTEGPETVGSPPTWERCRRGTWTR